MMACANSAEDTISLAPAKRVLPAIDEPQITVLVDAAPVTGVVSRIAEVSTVTRSSFQ
jgi:hypothetical protein